MRATESRPGRACPLHYRYSPGALARAPAFTAETLYVVGGLYGNPLALETVLEMARAEAGPVKLVFNGDFNWFNVDAASFDSINEQVLAHAALRGNVETELAAASEAAGCGCGYPDWVGDAEVERSNAIMSALRRTAAARPELRARLAELPMHLVAGVGDLRVGIVHGDAEALAGWGFSQEALRDDPARAQSLLSDSGVRILACSHTCLPVSQDFETPAGRALVANNGAAGMANFRGHSFGLITRISTRPAMHPAARPAPEPLYGMALDGVHVDGVPVRFDLRAWIEHFDRVWPEGSPAAVSYRSRIASGPAYELARAVRGGVAQYASPRPARMA